MDTTLVIFFLLGTACGVLMIWIAVSMYIKVKKCVSPVQGRYVKYELSYQAKGRSLYTPVFQYKYDHKKQEGKAINRYTGAWRLKRTYKKDEFYTIWVNPEKPSQYVTTKRVPPVYYVLFVSGIIELISVVCMIAS